MHRTLVWPNDFEGLPTYTGAVLQECRHHDVLGRIIFLLTENLLCRRLYSLYKTRNKIYWPTFSCCLITDNLCIVLTCDKYLFSDSMLFLWLYVCAFL